MKNCILVLVICFSSFCVFGQGLWTQKAAPPNNNSDNLSFTLNGIGYIYTGAATNNFYAYDPVSDTWVAQANFPGVARSRAAGFATSSYGYIGTGSAGSVMLNDFYKYDPVANSWSAAASYPDTITYGFGFAIGTTGYICGGVYHTNQLRTGNYAYDESSNTWTAKTPIPLAMAYGFSAVVNSKGYCGSGVVSGGQRAGDIYEYDPVGNSWTAMTTSVISGPPSLRLNSFVINNKIYVADPLDGVVNSHAVLRIFDVISNAWSVGDVFPYPKACNNFNALVSFNIANKGYLGGNTICSTGSLWQYDTAYHFTITAFSRDSVCEDDTVTVSFASNLVFNSGNHFKLHLSSGSMAATGDSIAGTTAGAYTFRVPHGAFNGLTSPVSMNVYSTDPPAQSGYYAPTMLIKRSPRDIHMTNDFSSCGGSAVLLYRENASGETHTWTSDPPGVSGSSYSLSFTPTATTSIFVYDVFPTTGCGLRDTALITLHGQPALNITDSVFAICPGGSVTLGGIHTTDASYTWTGNGLSSSSVNPVVSPATSGTYHVLVHDTVTTCSISGNTTVTIKQPPSQAICFVTVDSASTHNVVIWEKLDKYATDSFHIYRETSTGIYTEIGAVHRDSLSEYHDYTANPNVTAYRYKISASDTCHNGSTPSHYHNTIHLQYLGGGNLIWNVYQIENETTPVTSFDVYWDTLANGNWQVMINVPGNQYTATDINFSRHPAALYRVVANWSYTCTPTRSGSSSVLSNVINIGPNGINNISQEDNIWLYPNPAKSIITILTGGEPIQEITIASTDGKVVTHIMAPPGNRVDVSNLANGIYIAEVMAGNITRKIKWIKMQ